MGGHGGLNILPQKKWNVYNYDNRDIVDKDKKKHAEELRKKMEKERANQLQNKLSVLKGQDQDHQQKSASEDEPKHHSLISRELQNIEAKRSKHINLFEEEQKIIQHRDQIEAKRLQEEQFLKDKNMDYSSKFLGTYNDEQKLPWYIKSKGTPKPSQHHTHRRHSNKPNKHIDGNNASKKQDDKTQKKEIFRQQRQRSRDQNNSHYHKKSEYEYSNRYDKYIKQSEAKRYHQVKPHESQEKPISQLDQMRIKRLKREEKERQKSNLLKQCYA